MADEKQGADGRDLGGAPAASSTKPPGVTDREWRRRRLAEGDMVGVRSHFKSIYLVPMVLVSPRLGVFATAFGEAAPGAGAAEAAANASHQATLGLIWVFSFCFYMNIFIFEWSRPWTYGFLATLAVFVAVGFAVDSPTFPVWETLKNWLAALEIRLSKATYFFFAVFFGFCALISWVRARMHFVVIESNEVQVYRNSLFGDRERISMLNPRVEVRVPDMIEYFHPFYRAGQIIIHAPNRSIVLDNVLQIRRIERITDRLGSSLQVRVTNEG